MLSIPENVEHVLVAPLNWGLGHASRCIPIIKELISRNYKVTLASDGEALDLLRLEFPNLHAISLPPYNVRYKKGNFFSIVLDNVSNVFSAIRKERKVLKEILKTEDIDFIISDSRFGFYTSQKPCVIISHQLNLMTAHSVLSFFLNKGNSFYLNQFDTCWVPDYEDRRLSGKLSDPKFIKNVKYIGPLSNLEKYKTEKKYDIGIVLSGPEPARTEWEQTLIEEYKDTNKRIALIRGTKKGYPIKGVDHWKVYALANRKLVNQILLESKLVISRSGYTSIMDYDKLGIQAKVTATPGQSEQEYLEGLHGGNITQKNNT